MSVFIAFIAYMAAFSVYRYLSPGGIMFYQGIALMLVMGSLYFVTTKYILKHTACVQPCLLFCLLAYSFDLTIPTTADRAYTIELLREIHNAPAGISEPALEANFKNDFITRHGGIKRRLMEQQVSGFVKNDNGQYKLTPLGIFLDDSIRFVCQVYNCKNK